LVLGEWPLLQDLQLKNTSITSKGIEAIIKQSNWPTLKCFNLSENKITEEGFAILSRRMDFT